MTNNNTTVAEYHLPMREFSPIDALNRRAAAIGSPRYAQATAGADYNGHAVRVWWNNYKRYYIAEYQWAGRVVLARGALAQCLRAALAEYDRGALGSSVSVVCNEADVDAEVADTLTRYTAGTEPKHPSWWTWRHAAARECARDSANPGMIVLRWDWELLQAASSRNAYEDELTMKYGSPYS